MIYLDNNATSFPEPGVWNFLGQFASQGYGNPSSVHRLGKKTRQMISETSEKICKQLGFRGKVVYTSGATESLNLAIASLPKHSHVITSSSEHPAIIEPLKRAPFSVTYLDPDPKSCSLSPQQVRQAITPKTSALVLSWANSEIGFKTDVEAMAQLTQEHHIQYILDATAIVGREHISVPKGVTMMAFSGHKFHALPGTGVLLLAPNTRISPVFYGGGQQEGIRSGTENYYGIASLLYIFSQLEDKQPEIQQRITALRDSFEERLLEALPKIHVHCRENTRVNNVSAIAFPPLEGEVIQIALDMEGVMCSYGSACSSGATTAFKSLTGMGIEPSLAAATLRFSFSHLLTKEELDQAIAIIIRVVKRLYQAY